MVDLTLCFLSLAKRLGGDLVLRVASLYRIALPERVRGAFPEVAGRRWLNQSPFPLFFSSALLFVSISDFLQYIAAV
jgi:hypothetical protein